MSWCAVAAWALPVALVSPAPAQVQAALPVAPSVEEVAALPEELRLQQQVALKAVWLERLIRAREERHRVTRENLSHCVLLAKKLGAPELFVDMLRLQAGGTLSPRQRHALDSAQQDLLAVYGVDAREIRFFVEGCGLPAEQLRDVAAWLPLQALFNVVVPPAEPLTEEGLHAVVSDLLQQMRTLTELLQGVCDAESAEAAAELLRPMVMFQQQALIRLKTAPEAVHAAVLRARVGDIAPVQKAYDAERSRLMQHLWFGSHRLQVLDYVLN